MFRSMDFYDDEVGCVVISGLYTCIDIDTTSRGLVKLPLSVVHIVAVGKYIVSHVD